MIYWPAKAPGESEDFAFDFTGVLAQGESIATKSVTATGATVSNIGGTSPKVSFFLSGGALGTPAIVTCTITTDSTPARTFSETAIVPIGEEPVSLDMAKRQVRAEGTTADDDYLLELIQSAREHVEAYCGIRIVPAAVAMTFDRWSDLDQLTKAPVQSITSVQYYDANGLQQTLDPSVYEFVNLNSDPLRPALRAAYDQSWPAARSASDVITVNAVVGYTAAPRPLIRAILMLVTQWFDNRSPVQVDGRGQPAEIPNAVASLLANFRR